MIWLLRCPSCPTPLRSGPDDNHDDFDDDHDDLDDNHDDYDDNHDDENLVTEGKCDDDLRVDILSHSSR